MKEPAYLPRPGDLPRAELAAMADKVILDAGGPDHCRVFFKFTCQWCGTRCTLNEANMLYENGECFKCGKLTKIDFGGFSLFV